MGILAVVGSSLSEAGDFEAAHAGHHEVEDDDVGGVGFARRRNRSRR